MFVLRWREKKNLQYSVAWPAVIFDVAAKLSPLREKTLFWRCKIYDVIKFHLRFSNNAIQKSHWFAHLHCLNIECHHILFINYWQRRLFIAGTFKRNDLFWMKAELFNLFHLWQTILWMGFVALASWPILLACQEWNRLIYNIFTTLFNHFSSFRTILRSFVAPQILESGEIV